MYYLGTNAILIPVDLGETWDSVFLFNKLPDDIDTAAMSCKI